MSQPATPTKRGHPVRIRRPNPRIFDEMESEPPRQSMARYTGATVKSKKPTLSNLPLAKSLSTPDRKAAQSLGMRLRNLLKLPKAHKWVCYEWFYSNIDIPLFKGENDFSVCLKESFPQLKTRMLTRTEWCKIRRLMGKPRRCSAAFFTEERAVLHKKRDKIRALQQRKDVHSVEIKDLPEEIPLPLSIGTTVTARLRYPQDYLFLDNKLPRGSRLRYPQDGLFTGVIDAVDTVNNSYRVTFDKLGLGIHSVPDIEVLSNDPNETIPLNAFKIRKRPHSYFLSPVRYCIDPNSPGLVGDNDPLLGSSPMKVNLGNLEDGTLGGFPVKFLVLVTRLTKILQLKRKKVRELKDMNTEAEKTKALGQVLATHFQQRYAAIVLELESLNKELNQHLVGVQDYSQEVAPDATVSALDQVTELQKDCDLEADKVAPDATVSALDQVTELQKDCDLEATELVDLNNTGPNGRKMVRNEKMLDLITKLTSLLLQIRTFSENDLHSFEFKSLQDALAEIKKHIDPSNKMVFQNHVEIHVNHVQSGLSQMGNLHAFHTSAQTNYI